MTSEQSEILTNVQDGVGTITLNRPDRMNAWTPTMERLFRESVQQFDASEEVRCILVTGAGKAFCAGADTARLSDAAAGAIPMAEQVQRGNGNFDQRYSYLLSVGTPMVAGINGAVAGVGLCIALYCDIRFMAAGAKLTTAFARRGLIAEHGISWLLPRLIGPMNALDLLMTGRTVTAEEAERLGLVRGVRSEAFADTVRAYSKELATLSSPRSTRIIKRQVWEDMFRDLGTAVQEADEQQSLCRDTEDFREGVASFVERRPPRFTGR